MQQASGGSGVCLHPAVLERGSREFKCRGCKPLPLKYLNILTWALFITSLFPESELCFK